MYSLCSAKDLFVHDSIILGVICEEYYYKVGTYEKFQIGLSFKNVPQGLSDYFTLHIDFIDRS